jgi:hypothetical protein
MTDAGGLPTPADSSHCRVDGLAVDDWDAMVPMLAVASAAPVVLGSAAPVV